MAAYAWFMTHVTCRLPAKNRDQLQNRTLGNRVRATFTFLADPHANVTLTQILTPNFHLSQPETNILQMTSNFKDISNFLSLQRRYRR